MRATDAPFLEALRQSIGKYRRESPGENDVLFSADCGIERTLPGGKVVYGKSSLFFQTLRIFEGRSRDEMAGRLIAFVRNMVSYPANEFLRVRAGGVALDQAAVILPSRPEPHLPALVALLVASGTGYLGDETVHLDPILRRVHGTSLPLLIDSDDVSLFPQLEQAAPRGRRRPIRQGEDFRALTPRHVVPVQELGGEEAEPSRLGWIVFPEFDPGAETRVEPLGGSEALFRFTSAGLNLHVWEDRGLLLMRELLESVPVSRLTVGSLPEAASLLVSEAAQVVEVTASQWGPGRD